MIKHIFNFLSSLALFIFSINFLTSSLKNINKEKYLQNITKTNSIIKGIITGTIITSIFQSSSFITVLVVSLVDSSILSLTNAIGIVMGSNIGTCITSWLLSLSSVKYLSFFELENLMGICAIIGLILLLKKRIKISNILFGILILILSMNLMTESMIPLTQMSNFQKVIQYFENPLLGLCLGIILTGLFQSSSLIIGILEGLSINTNISFLSGFTIILGSNIGTCITAIIASMNTNKTSKIVSMFHLVFNIIGTIIFLISFYLLNYFFHFTFTYQNINPFHIALIHTIFNLGSTIILVPFTNQLIKISKQLIK